MKKILPLILSTILLMSIVPTMIFADGIESVVSGNLTWSYDPSAKILTISGNGNMLDYTMDNITGNRPNPYFDRKDEIVSIIVEEGVTSIGDWAFHNYIALENITLPETLKSIGYGAFDNTDLGHIEFPSSLTTLSDIFYMTEPAGIMVFNGNAPTLENWTGFYKEKTNPAKYVTRIYYPKDNTTWTEEIRGDFGKYILWNDEEESTIKVEDIFKDIKSDVWYTPAIQYVFDNLLMIGTSETTFSPLIKLTREQLMQVFFAMEGLDKADYEGETGFVDVSEGRWYSPAVKWAKTEGITNGIKEDTFGIGQYVTREQLATFIMNYVKYKNGDIASNADLTRFSDVDDISDWAVAGMEFCVEKGIINGRANGTLDPRTPANRAELAQILKQYAAM